MKDDETKRDDAINKRRSKSYGKVEASKSKSKYAKSDGTNVKRGRDEKVKGKLANSTDTVASSKPKRDSSGHAKGATRHKDPKRHKTSLGVRSDQSVNRHKLCVPKIIFCQKLSFSKLDTLSVGAQSTENNISKKKSSKSSKSAETNAKRGRDEKVEGELAKSTGTVASSKVDTFRHAKSAIRRKESKRPKTSSSVRSDQSPNGPKLATFSSGVNNKENNIAKKKFSTSSKSLSKPSGRRRRKSSVEGKRKANDLGMESFSDNGSFL